MRNVFLAIILISSLSFTYAQDSSADSPINRGTILLNGSIRLEKAADSGPRLDPFDHVGSRDLVFINLKAGYFIAKNLTLGGEYTRSLYRDNANLFGRYYFKGKIIGGVAYNFREEAGVVEGGYAFFAAPFVAFETAINYQKGLYGIGDSDGVGLNFSVSFFLNRRIKKD